MRLWVVKVGGSLLDWPELPARLGAYLRASEAEGRRPLLIAGGGRAADAVRELDRVHGLGEERAHRLALRALDLTAHALADLLPGAIVVDEPAAPAKVAGTVPVLAPRRLLDEDDRRSADPLPHRWEVTTDSIAARVALLLGAEGLALLKSAPLPPGVDRREATRLGLVDSYFPVASSTLGRIEYLDLRGGLGPRPLVGDRPANDADRRESG